MTRTALFFVGLVAIAIGAGLIYLPAGLIVGGALAATVAIALERGS
jgi:hypothetical protein